MSGYEVPVFNLGNPTWIQAVAVAETPQELAPYAGRYLAVTDDANLPPLGTRGIVVVNGIEVPGFLRNLNGNYEWVIMPRQDPMEVLVIGLPGPSGWADQNAGMTWFQIGMSLRGYGVSGQDLAWGLNALFQAARTEILAEQAQQQSAKAVGSKATA